mmetsp:Transcript_8319/g.16930  ORF Transcript_8319/g.16930 Transcript_8319/m.16930 type:complete len:84 (-) Transcript_8319:511-762(-)
MPVRLFVVLEPYLRGVSIRRLRVLLVLSMVVAMSVIGLVFVPLQFGMESVRAVPRRDEVVGAMGARLGDDVDGPHAVLAFPPG